VTVDARSRRRRAAVEPGVRDEDAVDQQVVAATSLHSDAVAVACQRAPAAAADAVQVAFLPHDGPR